MKRAIYASNVVKIAELINDIDLSEIQDKPNDASILITLFKSSLKEFKQPLSHHMPPIDQLDQQLNCLIKLTRDIFNHLDTQKQKFIFNKIKKLARTK